MTSLSRDINDTARAFCATKNELLVVMALSNQTIGYGKASDPLTDKRLAKLTGIRLDRLRPAINAVIKKGLFDRKPHERFSYEYSIGKMFLEAYQGKVYTPFILKNRNSTEKENPKNRNDGNLTEKRTHTITKHTSPQSPQQTEETKQTKSLNSPPQTEETKKMTLLNSPQLQKQTVQPVEQQSVKLFFTDETQIPRSFAIEASSANTRIEFSFGATACEPIKTTVETVTEPPTITTPNTIATLKKVIDTVKKVEESPVEKLLVEQPAEEKIPTKILATKPVTTELPTEKCEPWQDDALAIADRLDQMEEQQKEKQEIEPEAAQKTINPIIAKPTASQPATPKAAIIPLPTIVGEENYNACNRYFNVLNDEQKKELVLVFNYNRKTRTVNNPAGYFITLAKTAAEGGITVPPDAIVKQPPTAEQIAATKERQQSLSYWSDFRWLQENAARQGVPIETLAKDMGEQMEAAYAMFIEHVPKQ